MCIVRQLWNVHAWQMRGVYVRGRAAGQHSGWKVRKHVLRVLPWRRSDPVPGHADHMPPSHSKSVAKRDSAAHACVERAAEGTLLPRRERIGQVEHADASPRLPSSSPPYPCKRRCHHYDFSNAHDRARPQRRESIFREEKKVRRCALTSNAYKVVASLH